MSRRAMQFQTIRSEGAILPADVILAIASLTVDGISPESFHLPPGTKLNEAISRSWTTLLAHWKAFQEARAKIPDSDETGTAITNDRWLLPLFKELDYGRLTTVKAPEIDGRVYPIERFYQHTPIHLIGCKLPLDTRTQGARGAATANPHSMVQEYLNRTESCLWGFLSNGLELRILRDNVSLSRQAYIEFDLESLFSGEVYADFALLWMLCHQSRVEAEKPSDCWLEKWSHLARERGTRVLADLRTGVQKAIEALGRGFISHPRNDALRNKLRAGTLATQDCYRQLLRIVYRLLFLFVAEDRGLLHPPGAGEGACDLYDEHYSTGRLRELAQSMRGSKHGDLWHSLSLVFDALGQSGGCRALGLPGLGSFLWRRSSVGDLLGPAPKGAEAVSHPVLISNDDLLAAIRALAFIEQDGVLRTVDYRNLGSEELGSVYESLLELHPEIQIEGRGFSLSVAAGHERKTTGSYYTPDSLVQCLLDSALEPVVAERIKDKKADEAERAILELKVCDPACGSGHFLIAAAHRLARHLARARTGENEPGPKDHQHALRDVIGRCIYGVDLNPMAVELCQVSLWIEALEPGRPLSFLEHHIQCGNSLLGATPALLEKGIPDEAFTAIEGDVKSRVSELKRQNKRERAEHAHGQGYMFEALTKLGNMAADFARVTLAPTETLAEVHDQEGRYTALVRGAAYQNARLLADAWCAAFVWKNDDSDLGKLCPTERDFRKVESHAAAGLLPHVRGEVERLRGQYQFFHWHLAFPDVFRFPGNDEQPENEHSGWSGGFDVMLGNPPWERVKLQEREFFAGPRPDIANAATAAIRGRMIAQLATTDPALFAAYELALRTAEAESSFTRNSGRFPYGASGDTNTYPLFIELGEGAIGRNSRVGIIVKTGILADYSLRDLFYHLVQTGRLVSAFDFSNGKLIFSDVVANERFTLLTVGGENANVGDITISILNEEVADLGKADRIWHLSRDDVRLINPNTHTCPLFQNATDAVLVSGVYRRHPVLIREGDDNGNQWVANYYTMFHMTNDSSLFRDAETLQASSSHQVSPHWPTNDGDYVTLIEGKLFDLFDHRHGTFEGVPRESRFGIKAEPNHLSLEQKRQPDNICLPRYWVPVDEVRSRYSDRLGFQPSAVLTFRDVCRTHTDLRTVRACIFPPVGAGNKAPLFLFSKTALDEHSVRSALLGANLTSFVLDYIARQKFAGGSLNRFIIIQFPVVARSSFQEPCWWCGLPQSAVTHQQFLLPRVLELTYTTWDLEPFARDCGYAGSPFRWEEERRFLLRAELDAAYFHLYLRSDEDGDWVPARKANGCPYDESPEDLARLKASFPKPRDALSYIMDTFPIVRRKDEEKYNGDYRTKRVILEIYDTMQKAIRTAVPYQTMIDPPPADPRVAHLPRPQQLAQVDIVADVLLLLREWNSAVSILALEPAVLLMQNEGARNAFLGHTKSVKATAKGTSAYKPIEGMDLIYRGLVANGAIEAVGQNGYRILKPELVAGLSAGNRQRAKQVIEAIRKLDRPEDTLAVVAEITNERYSIAIS